MFSEAFTKSRVRLRSCCALLFVIFVCSVASAAAPSSPTKADEQAYQSALNMVREGKHEAALTDLDSLVQRYPHERRFRHDYIATLSWAEHNREALAEAASLDLQQTPPFVLEALGKAARNVRDYSSALTYYREAVARDPARVPAQLGYAYALAETQQADQALDVLNGLLADQPNRISALEAKAFALRANGDNFGALRCYTRILQIDPTHREAKRGQILAAGQVGAVHQALSLAEQNPGLFTDQELLRIRDDVAANALRWGKIYEPNPSTRYRDTDAGIEQIEASLAELARQEQLMTPRGQRLRADLLVGYRDRQRFVDAIAIYEALLEEDATIPIYAHSAAADAYLAERQPERARDVYLAVLQQTPNDANAKLNLFFAYMDIPDYNTAVNWIDQLAAEQPQWLKPPGATQRARNPTKVTADSNAALARAWTDRLGDAQLRFDGLLEVAPQNLDLKTERGFVFLWRGWPRHAGEEFEYVQRVDREHFGARVGEYQSLFDRQRYEEAESALLSLEQTNPEIKRVHRLRRSWEIHNLREMRLDISRGRSTGLSQGSDYLTSNAYVFTRPWHHKYRAYGRVHYGWADFPEGRALYRRYGGGLEYRVSDLTLTGDLSSGPDPYSDFGLSASADWRITDHWRLSANASSYSDDVPLRGRLNEQIDGWSGGLTIERRSNESRLWNVGLQVVDMSDGNRRRSMTANWFERLVTGPIYKLDAWLGLYASTNTRDRLQSSYFNPKSDFSPTLTLINEWLVARRFERNFKHRLGTTVGTYKQEEFGSGSLWRIFYEHDWVRDERFELVYGISRGAHPYDGVTEYENTYYLTLNWRF